MESSRETTHSLKNTFIAFMVVNAITWGATVSFFARLDQFRRTQVKKIASDLKASVIVVGEHHEMSVKEFKMIEDIGIDCDRLLEILERLEKQ